MIAGIETARPYYRALISSARHRMAFNFNREPKIADIQRAVADCFGISFDEIRSDRHTARLARPRQVAMYLAKELTTRSLSDIARFFDRDHSTIASGINRIAELMSEDRSFRLMVEAARRDIALASIITKPRPSAGG